MASFVAPQKTEFGRHDIVVLLNRTPEPLLRYAVQRMATIGVTVVREDHPDDECKSMLLLHATQSILEEQAEELRLEMPLVTTAKRTWAETDHPVRVYNSSQKSAFGDVEFSVSQRAALLHAFLDANFVTDEAWTAALVAAGRSDAAERPSPRWLIGPTHSWSHQPLLLALGQLGYMELTWAAHTFGRHESLGVPLTPTHAVDWRAFATGLLTLRLDLVSPSRIRDYWGEGPAFYFAWQLFYIKALALPAAGGLIVWLRRPPHLSIDDDPYVPLFSLLATVWAIGFVQSWRGRQAGRHAGACRRRFPSACGS